MGDSVVGNGADSRIAVDHFLLAFGCRVAVIEGAHVRVENSPHFRKLLDELGGDFCGMKFQCGDVGIFVAVVPDSQTGNHLRNKCGIKLFALDSDDVFHVVGIHIVVAEKSREKDGTTKVDNLFDGCLRRKRLAAPAHVAHVAK